MIRVRHVAKYSVQHCWVGTTTDASRGSWSLHRNIHTCAYGVYEYQLEAADVALGRTLSRYPLNCPQVRMWEWMFVCLHIQTDIQYTHWLHIIHIFPLHNNTHFKCSATWGIKGHRYSFSIVFCPCCLCAEISLDSLRLLMIIMDHRLWNPWILCACMLGNVVLKLTGLFAHTVGHSGEPHPTLAYEQLSLSEMHFLFRIIFPINLFIFGMFQTDVWWVFLNLLCLLLLLVPLSQLLENMLLASH